ncbi:hypothetical protein [Nostoc sp. FACHB-110]|uniref:hypothetical protein n=1 Tax=Nostoc sp. FACHB-110 TaxID=2692834 RepID=UPI0016837BBC|nr:hypothetical protein [Nostoc sp. FACHB-110]MBD2440256.1 hypothetical protein [Nostoc sp. FACHB-110]
MDNSEQAYEFYILQIAINKYLDNNFQKLEKDLQILESNKDEVVWDIVSTIYIQSGYKVSMNLVRDIVTQRIKDTKDKLKEDEEKAHQEMIAFQEMIKIEAEKEQTRQQLLRIKAEEEKAKQEEIKLERKHKITNFICSLPKEMNFDEIKLDVFVRVHRLCCEHYSYYPYSDKLNEEEVLHIELFITILETKVFEHTLYDAYNFTPVLSYEYGRFYKWIWGTCNDDCDAHELLMAFEEEFDIEISDEEAGKTETEKSVYLKDIVECIYTKITK